MWNAKQFSQLIDRISKDLHTDTTTIYTLDPWTSGKEYRLIWMEGVEDRAPMYGPVHPEISVERLLAEPRRMLFVPDVTRSQLFADSSFVRRESIKSLARFHLLTDPPHNPERPGAILFVSYRCEQRFEVDYVMRLEVATSVIETMLSQFIGTSVVDPALSSQQVAWLAQIARATRDIISASGVDEVIEHVLRSALTVTAVGDSGYCCVHLVQPDNKSIRCAYRVWQGQFDTALGSEVDIETGPGITTKVARDQRPLFLQDIKATCQRWTARYSYILHSDVEDAEFESELVVPMYAKGRLIGTLNIETADRKALRPEHVRVMEALADTAAIAIIESRFMERLNRIIESAAEIDPAQDLYEVIERIRHQVAKHMDADDSDFWRYRGGRFDKPVPTSSAQPQNQEQDGELSGRPRSQEQDGVGGISEYLLKDCQKSKPPAKAVLVTEMNHANRECELRIATRKGGVLKVQQVQKEIRLNPRMDSDVLTEAGLPLIFRNEPLGVLWVKWHSEHTFTDEEILLLDVLSNQASLAFHIADIIQKPIDEAFRRIFRPTFGDHRAPYFASHRELLEVMRFPKITVMIAKIRASTEVLSILLRTDSHRQFNSLTTDFYKQAATIVHSHSGALAAFWGDGIMAVFGAPLVPGEPTDPGAHAIEAALAAIELAEYFDSRLPVWVNDIFRHAGGASVPEGFGLAVGLTTDSVLVGDFAKGEGFSFMALGWARTIASRIENTIQAKVLEDLWPDDGSRPGSVVVLCPQSMEQYFRRVGHITVTPLQAPVALSGLDGTFSLGILRRAVPRPQS